MATTLSMKLLKFIFLALTAVIALSQTVVDSNIQATHVRHTAMYSLVQKQAPKFTTDAVLPDGSFSEISLDDYKGKYVLLFFYPHDFTFVCPSEILAFDAAVEEFRSKGVNVLGCSVDSKFVHYNWRNTELSKGGIGPIKFPLLADVSHRIAEAYGVLLPEGMALRGTFLIDREGTIRHASINDLPLGRSVDEVMRLVDALQFVEKEGDVCPANWKKGKTAMKPTAAGVAAYLASHFDNEPKKF